MTSRSRRRLRTIAAEVLPLPERPAEERPVLVVDLGGQYAQLIARRVRECRVYSELVGHGVTAAQVRARNPHAVILSGGPASVYAEGAPHVDPEVFALGIPTLGICYGAQLLALDLGGTVERTGASEFGKAELTGVESAVAALLVHKAIGDQLACVFVDHGLLRENEADQVVETFDGHFRVPLVHVQAQERFLSRLEGVDDPEQKRKIVGEEFIRVFEEEAGNLGDIRFLVQGTLYSDVIESGGGEDGVAAMIKSHHNVGGLPADMSMELVEPLRLLFKDEVRRVGEELGMPERMVWRQPFPGPGLAIRIIGDVTEERLAILRSADAILQEEIRRAGLYRELWQSFAVLPAIRSVGVQGDERTYVYPIVIRAVTSDDAMTADWARLPYDLLETISSRIINEIPGVNRVALDLSSKPPATIEWE